MFKIGIIGVGGRTGTMFFQELKKISKVFGIGREKEIEKIKNKKIFVKKNGKLEIVEGNLIEEKEFPKGIDFDFLFLTVKNPIKSALKFYYQKIKEKNLKIPILFLSQNGIGVVEDAISTLKEIFGKKEIPIFRTSLFNAIDKKVEKGNEIIEYSLPIRLALAKVSGKENEKEIKKIFEKAKFEVFLVSKKDRKNMEYSKLFLNLIGMASATHGLSIFEGFSKKEIFKEEFLAMREYVKIIKKTGGKFLNFPHYPVKFFSLFLNLPFSFLFPFRKKIAKIIERKRSKKPKELGEIEYYNGAVVKLANKVKIKAEINKKILERAKSCLSKE